MYCMCERGNLTSAADREVKQQTVNKENPQEKCEHMKGIKSIWASEVVQHEMES